MGWLAAHLQSVGYAVECKSFYLSTREFSFFIAMKRGRQERRGERRDMGMRGAANGVGYMAAPEPAS